MSILVFPAALAASARFAAEAGFWGRRVVGASSIEKDPNAGLFDAFAYLPFIGEPAFLPALEALAAREGITAIFTPHAPTFHLLAQDLSTRLPGVRLMGEGPFQGQMGKIAKIQDLARDALATVHAYGEGPSWVSAEVLGAILMQVETIHGECSREKILAICGVGPGAPKGDVVEIGALFGKSSYVLNRIAACGSIGATICVDPWDLGRSVQMDAPSHIQTASQGWDWEVVHQGFVLAMLGCSTPPFNYLRMPSKEACAHYQSVRSISSPAFGVTPTQGAISILHLDGNHDEAAVAEDFDLWAPLVRPGGWIIFDDYHWPHGDGPRRVADRAIAQYGQGLERRFEAGGAMFLKLAA